jgi:hypothetical protein
MKYALMLLMLAACGDSSYVVSGNVTVTHKIDLAVEWFETYCAEMYPEDEEGRDYCIETLTMDFIKTLAGSGK